MNEKDIYFAAGCFWGAEKFFRLISGVLATEVGFANGRTPAPTYRQVYTDTTGYAETVHVRYDADVLPLADLARLFFRIIDPLSMNKQGEDEGTRYRTGVYYTDAADWALLEPVFRATAAALGTAELATELLPLQNFYPAEDEHQQYLDKNPNGYCHLSPAFFELAREFKKKVAESK